MEPPEKQRLCVDKPRSHEPRRPKPDEASGKPPESPRPYTPIDYAESVQMQWLHDLERQRQGLYDALFEVIQEDLSECDAFITQAQLRPTKLLATCADSSREANWSLPQKRYLSQRIEQHKESCLQHIAFLELIIHDLALLQSRTGHPTVTKMANDTLAILSSKGFGDGINWVAQSFAQGHQHLLAINMFIGTEKYEADRAQGGKDKALNSVVYEDKDRIVRALVKVLIHSEPRSPDFNTGDGLVKRYTEEIMRIWQVWPFFRFDKDDLVQVVRDVLSNKKLAAIPKKSVFERRRRTPMAKPRQDAQFDAKARECEAWQGGLATALVHILEASFGSVDEAHVKKIEAASPEQIGIWLSRTRYANSQDEVIC